MILHDFLKIDYQKKIHLFREMILKENQIMNLISRKTESEIDNRHIKDSLQLLNYINNEKVIIDLGSGSGFPGIIIGIVKEDVLIYLCEKSKKKANFLNKVKKELSLDNVIIFNKNIYEIFPNIEEKKILITSRAFKSLKETFNLLNYHNIFKKYCISLLLLKGKDVIIELDDAKMIYKFDYTLNNSITNEGFVLKIENIKKYEK